MLDELVEAVTHHVEEEEERCCPGMRERMSAEPARPARRGVRGSRDEHLGDQPDDITKSQLKQQADNLDLAGTSGMGKAELKSELSEHADE